MTHLEKRIALALRTFFQTEGWSTTLEQRDALIDQLALVMSDHVGQQQFHYDAFRESCHPN
jgi:hypothetical protein